MSPVPMPLAAEHDDAARWRAWELGYRTSSHRAAIQMRVVFAVFLTGAAAWLGLQLFSMPV
jgi:hypothetical protein